MSEPTYLELDEAEDFSMEAHVESDGYQRVVAQGYLTKTERDGTYRTPLLPQMFFGADGTQLSTWRQYLTAGDHVILSRDSGNPVVSDLHWTRVRGPVPAQRTPTHVAPTATMEIPWVGIAVLVGLPIAFYILYKTLGKALK